MKSYRWVIVMAALLLTIKVSAARAEIVLDMVTVGNVGNANDTTGYGGVDHVYAIGKYEVTAGQYTVFLNNAAATDPYGLYNANMWAVSTGCKIQRSGSAGSYTYSVAADSANRPVNYVSWGDAARFVNWLHNGQGNGSTETGAYSLNGVLSNAALMGITRNADAKFWIPSESEWYKAAYHKNNGVTGDYWDYPTSSDSMPSNDLASPDPGNNANFDQGGYTIDSPYWRTEVGEFENSESPYGTFDQGGNVWEWDEAAVTSSERGVRGASYLMRSNRMLASDRGYLAATTENSDIGFRVASVPEPSSIAMFSCGALAGLAWLYRKRKS